MIMTSPRGIEIAERARLLFADLGELKKKQPGDANQIAAMILAHVRSDFGSAADLMLLSSGSDLGLQSK
jgi:hypothetical protein